MSTTLRFDGLPFWQGVCARPNPPVTLPLVLERDPRGFWRQGGDGTQRERLSRIYARDDYAFITPPPGASDWANTLGDIKVRGLLSCCPSLDGLDMLEVGAGSLFVARALRQRFAVRSYVAVDPALTENPSDGIETVRDFFPSDALAGRGFDLIVAFSCLEHMEDPVVFLRGCAECLRPEGAGIFLVFPDVGEALRSGDLGILVHEHLSYFDEAGFCNAAAAAGLGVRSLVSARGMFLALCHLNACGGGAPLPTVEGFVSAYETGVSALAAQVRAALDRGRVAFHGANPGLNNFLWLAGLAGDPRVAVFDNDRAKWGHYLPTCPNPIRPPEGEAYLKADPIYVSATAFFAEIQGALIRQGVPGERIRPLLPGRSSPCP